ncbi:MAG: hypothetical protein PHX27_02125 [Candidatus ainarchaeum sp.]|nr:hypothetical protein [Candidatus ainarchaeum sp.]
MYLSKIRSFYDKLLWWEKAFVKYFIWSFFLTITFLIINIFISGLGEILEVFLIAPAIILLWIIFPILKLGPLYWNPFNIALGKISSFVFWGLIGIILNFIGAKIKNKFIRIMLISIIIIIILLLGIYLLVGVSSYLPFL